MSTTTAVLVTGVSTGVALLGTEVLLGTRRQLAAAAEPVAAEQWLVTQLAARPRLRALVEHTDRRVVGEIAAAISLLMVFAAALAVGWTWFLLVAVIFGGRLRRFGEPFEDVATIAHGLDDDARVAVVSRVTSSQHDGGRHGM